MPNSKMLKPKSIKKVEYKNFLQLLISTPAYYPPDLVTNKIFQAFFRLIYFNRVEMKIMKLKWLIIKIKTIHIQ